MEASKSSSSGGDRRFFFDVFGHRLHVKFFSSFSPGKKVEQNVSFALRSPFLCEEEGEEKKIGPLLRAVRQQM